MNLPLVNFITIHPATGGRRPPQNLCLYRKVALFCDSDVVHRNVSSRGSVQKRTRCSCLYGTKRAQYFDSLQEIKLTVKALHILHPVQSSSVSADTTTWKRPKTNSRLISSSLHVQQRTVLQNCRLDWTKLAHAVRCCSKGGCGPVATTKWLCSVQKRFQDGV